jgi:hypothetical protein
LEFYHDEPMSAGLENIDQQQLITASNRRSPVKA